MSKNWNWEWPVAEAKPTGKSNLFLEKWIVAQIDDQRMKTPLELVIEVGQITLGWPR